MIKNNINSGTNSRYLKMINVYVCNLQKNCTRVHTNYKRNNNYTLCMCRKQKAYLLEITPWKRQIFNLSEEHKTVQTTVVGL